MEVWFVATPPVDAWPCRAGDWSDEEWDRAQRFRRAEDRVRHLAAHQAKRRIIANYVDEHPSLLRFGVSALGKPFLADHPALRFNLSHSGCWAAVAVSSADVGIDVEEMRMFEAWREIALQHFSPAEAAEIDAQPEDGRLRAFYECWTRKEAVLKAAGVGLSVALTRVEVTETGGGFSSASVAGEPGRWNLASLSPSEGYAGAVAIGEGMALVMRNADAYGMFGP